MANPEHLKILKCGAMDWNRWRLENNDIRLNFVRADLSGADLSGLVLKGANLHLANLECANLSQANLQDCNLQFANLQRTNLTQTNMHDCDMREANLEGANLVEAKLFRADLSLANMRNTNLSKANMIATKLIGTILSNAILRETNLHSANLTQADLSFVDLTEAGMISANLHRAIFYNTNLEKLGIGNTIFSYNDLSSCKGLHTIIVGTPCSIDFYTLQTSKNLPKSLLVKMGLPELYVDYLPDFYQEEGIRFFPSFLSHSWSNKPFARKLYEALIAKGVNVFFDEKKFKPGDDLYESISKGIEHYDKMILVCSKESLSESWWVDREIDRVLAKERDLFKEVGKRINLLIPIRIDDYVFEWDGAKKEEVRRYMIGDFRNWEDDTAFDKSLNDLIIALNPDRPDIKPVSHLPKKPKT